MFTIFNQTFQCHSPFTSCFIIKVPNATSSSGSTIAIADGLSNDEPCGPCSPLSKSPASSCSSLSRSPASTCSPLSRSTLEQLPLPTYSNRVQPYLDSGEVHKEWHAFIEETSYYVLANGDMKHKGMYQDFGRAIYEKWPCIGHPGEHPWVILVLL